LESFDHARLIAAGKTMEQDRMPAQRDAQRGGPIIVRRAAGHSLRARPPAAAAFAETARGFFKRACVPARAQGLHWELRIVYSPPRTRPSPLLPEIAFLQPVVHFMFSYDSEQSRRTQMARRFILGVMWAVSFGGGASAQ